VSGLKTPALARHLQRNLAQPQRRILPAIALVALDRRPELSDVGTADGCVRVPRKRPGAGRRGDVQRISVAGNHEDIHIQSILGLEIQLLQERRKQAEQGAGGRIHADGEACSHDRQVASKARIAVAFGAVAVHVDAADDVEHQLAAVSS
jgi:hypothetical protein